MRACAPNAETMSDFWYYVGAGAMLVGGLWLSWLAASTQDGIDRRAEEEDES